MSSQFRWLILNYTHTTKLHFSVDLENTVQFSVNFPRLMKNLMAKRTKSSKVRRTHRLHTQNNSKTNEHHL